MRNLLPLCPMLALSAFTSNAEVHVQKLRETATEVIYRAEDPTNLDAYAMTNLMIEGKALRIEWPRQFVDPSLFIEMSKSFYLQWGMEADNIQFNSAATKLDVLQFDDAKTKQLVAESFRTDYLEVWRGQITDARLEKVGTSLVQLVNGKNTHFIEVRGKIAGIVMVDNFETYRGMHEDHLGWIWIDSSLDADLRRTIASTLLHATARVATGKILAGVYVRNMKSFNFLRKAGFESICVQLLQP